MFSEIPIPMKEYDLDIDNDPSKGQIIVTALAVLFMKLRFPLFSFQRHFPACHSS